MFYIVIGTQYTSQKVLLESCLWLAGSFKFNFNKCALGNPGFLGIGGIITSHGGIVLQAFSKLVERGIAIEAKILGFLGFSAGQSSVSF